MDRKTLTLYRKLRTEGERAHVALYAAKATRAFERMEALGLVRIGWVEDQERDLGNLAPDISSEAELEDMLDLINREGVWGRVGEYRLSEDHEWEHGGSVFGFIGQDAHGYEADIKAETLAALAKARS